MRRLPWPISPLTEAVEAFRTAVLAGLARRPKAIPCTFFYDAEGSALFERITALDEYYLTRTELAMMAELAPELGRLAGPCRHVVEFGAGSAVKARLLLSALDTPAAYTAIDVSRDHVKAAMRQLVAEFPRVAVAAVVGDFTQGAGPGRLRGRPLGFFPGSTIGNLQPREAMEFLTGAADLLAGGALLIGVDLVKDQALLEAAYNDTQGVTESFNKNLLARANRELDADFQLPRFDHRAVWNRSDSRVEMYLVSRMDQVVHVGGRGFAIRDGEAILTEYSHKWTVEGFRALAARAGFHPRRSWTDADRLFSLHWLEA